MSYEYLLSNTGAAPAITKKALSTVMIYAVSVEKVAHKSKTTVAVTAQKDSLTVQVTALITDFGKSDNGILLK